MRHGWLNSILGSFSIPGMYFPPITLPKILALDCTKVHQKKTKRSIENVVFDLPNLRVTGLWWFTNTRHSHLQQSKQPPHTYPVYIVQIDVHELDICLFNKAESYSVDVLVEDRSEAAEDLVARNIPELQDQLFLLVQQLFHLKSCVCGYPGRQKNPSTQSQHSRPAPVLLIASSGEGSKDFVLECGMPIAEPNSNSGVL